MNLSLTTINEIANDFVLTKGGNPDDIMVYGSILFGGLQHIQIHYIKQLKEAKVEKNAINYVDYPKDCITPVSLKLGYNGREYPIYPDSELDTFVDTDCSAEVAPTEPSTDTFFPDYDYTNAFNNIKYKINDTARRIRITGDVPAGCIIKLKYVFNGIEDGLETYVPRAYFQLLKAWLIWQLDSENPMKKQNWADFLRESRAYRFRITKDQYVHDIYELQSSRL